MFVALVGDLPTNPAWMEGQGEVSGRVAHQLRLRRQVGGRWAWLVCWWWGRWGEAEVSDWSGLFGAGRRAEGDVVDAVQGCDIIWSG